MTDNTLRTSLESHPRIVGVLFTVLVLLAQAGTAAAGVGAVAIHGP